jgi:ribosomal protein S18 acetylase RimI-like enzyme
MLHRMTSAEHGSDQKGAEIRRARPAQWVTYRQLRLTALADSPQAFSSTLAGEQVLAGELWRGRLDSATAASFLAWQDDRPVGMATGKIDDPDDEFAVPGAWQLVGMWVAPEARGTGVADGLVEQVAAHALSAGAASLVLWVTEINGRARAFYRRAGFGPTGARQLVRPDDPGHYEVQMIRQLG